MGVIEFVLAIAFILAFLTGGSVGLVHVVHVLRRRYRLERQADERENKRQMAEDWQDLQKELSDNMSFTEYLASPSQPKNKLISVDK